MWLIVLAVILLVVVVPVMVGARIVGARRTGFGACLLALIVATLIASFALHAFHARGLLSVLAAALGYMIILDTSYLRGLAIALIQYVLAGVFIAIAAILIFGSIAAGTRHLMHDAPFRLDVPAQSV